MENNVQEQWINLPSMNTKRFLCAAAAVGDNMYVLGGENGEYVFESGEVYNTSSRTWTSTSDMSVKRSGCAAAVVDDKIYVLGGYDGKSYLSSAEVYDTSSKKWTSIADMGTKRSGCAAAAVGDKIYVLGGYDGKSDLSSVEMLNTNEWAFNSLFYKNLLEKDDRNIIFKISELVPLVEDVHQVKFMYTLLNSSYRLGYIDKSDRDKYMKEVLEKASKTTSCSHSIATYKVILKKAFKDDIIDDHTRYYLDREAEITHTSNAPFVKDIWMHIRMNTARIENLELRTEHLEDRCQALSESLVQLKKAIRRNLKNEAAVGVVSAILNAFSFGVAESVVGGVMRTTIGNIVDYSDLCHIKAVVGLVKDASVNDAFQEALLYINGDRKLMKVTAEGSHLLNNPSHMKKMGHNPLIALVLTAHVVSSNCTPDNDEIRGISDFNAGNCVVNTKSSSKKKIIDRVSHLEEELGLEDLPSLLVKRIANLEIQTFGEVNESGETPVHRIVRLESALIG